MSPTIFKLIRATLGLVVLAVAIGVLLVVAVRLARLPSKSVHYHANYALYVSGQRYEFDHFTFYEEVAACSVHGENPKQRAHMHDSKNHIVHVHDSGVTWGHFFANLGFTLGDKVLVTDDGVHVDGSNGKKLEFLLNGRDVETITNQIIGDHDVLLINYGNETKQELANRYESITKDAETVNSLQDPGSCAGDDHLSFSARLKRAFKIWE